MRNVVIVILFLITGAGGWLLGSQSAQKSPANDEELGDQQPVVAREPDVIRGIGKLEPESGIFKIFAPQGERIDSLYELQVGDHVDVGQPVVKLASLEIRELELALARAKKSDAYRQFDLEKSKGEKKRQGAELALEEAESVRNQILIKSRGIDLLREQLDGAKKQLNRFENLKSNPLTANMVGQTDLDKQQLLIGQLEARIKEAEDEIRLGNDKAARARQAAQVELDAVKLVLENGDATIPEETLDSAIAAAEKGVELSEIKAPIAGEILDIIVRPGDTAINQPVLILGDTSQMICVAEINDVNFRFIKKGDVATVSSVALEEPIAGTVISHGMMIGPPSMKDPNPFAGVDRKTGRVVIKLEANELSRRFVNLQVDVEITISNSDGKRPQP